MATNKDDSGCGLEAQDMVSLDDVLSDNGELDLLDEIMEQVRQSNERPPLIIHWQRVQEFVAAIQDVEARIQSYGMADTKPPFRMPEPLTPQAFKKALLEYARTGQAEPLGTSCLPCDTTEVCQSDARLADLRDNAWVQRVIEVGGAERVLPLASVYTASTPGSSVLKPAIYARPQRNLWNA